MKIIQTEKTNPSKTPTKRFAPICEFAISTLAEFASANSALAYSALAMLALATLASALGNWLTQI